MHASAVTLLSNASATGDPQTWPGGMGLFAADGTFNAGTITLQYQVTDGSWFAAGANTTLTSGGGGIFELGPGQIRALVTGGPPAGIYAVAAAIPA